MKAQLREVPKAPNFKMTMHLNLGSKGGAILYRDEEMKVQAETHTPKDKHGNWMKGTTTFFIDGDAREFDTLASMMEAWEEKMK